MSFSEVLTNGKLTGISFLTVKETILKKINVSFIIHFLVNTASVFIFLERTFYYKYYYVFYIIFNTIQLQLSFQAS